MARKAGRNRPGIIDDQQPKTVEHKHTREPMDRSMPPAMMSRPAARLRMPNKTQALADQEMRLCRGRVWWDINSAT